MLSELALANPTGAELHNNPALCSYGYNQNCGGYGGGYRVYYRADYLAVLHDKDYKEYIFKKTYRKYDPVWRDEYWQEAGDEALIACNASKKRSPCKFMNAVINDNCIAYLDTPDVFYTTLGNTCKEAKQEVNDRCTARYNDPKICKGIKTKKP